MYRRTALVIIATLLALGSDVGKGQIGYPNRPITIIVPTTAGSAPDLVARLINDQLAKSLGVPVVVEDKPGASGTIGLQRLASSAPDGYTFAMLALPYVVVPTMRKTTYRPEDFVPVRLLAWNYPVLAVPAKSSAHSVADLVALSRAKPGALTYASAGVGSPGHLGMELFKREAGVNLTHIPYRGNPAAVAAALAGDVDVFMGGLGALAPHIASEKLRALATAAPQRMAVYPDLPTLSELGYPGVKINDWQGIVAPAGTPAAIVARVEAALNAILDTPALKQQLEALGMEPAAGDAHQFGAFIRSEVQHWSGLVRDAGVTAD